MTAQTLEIPSYECKIQAGFPSPADDYMEGKIDLNKQYIKHPAATFFIKASDYSMTKSSIYPGDILIVDRSLEAYQRRIIVANIDGSLLIRRLHKTSKNTYLLPDNKEYEPIKLREGNEVIILGVITFVLHKV